VSQQLHQRLSFRPHTQPTPKNVDPSGLSTGAKIGISICVPLVFVIVGCTIILLYRRRKRRSNRRVVDVGEAENLPDVKGPPPYIEHQDHVPIVHDQNQNQVLGLRSYIVAPNTPDFCNSILCLWPLSASITHSISYLHITAIQPTSPYTSYKRNHKYP
jgi:hypothetical protein